MNRAQGHVGHARPDQHTGKLHNRGRGRSDVRCNVKGSHDH